MMESSSGVWIVWPVIPAGRFGLQISDTCVDIRNLEVVPIATGLHKSLESINIQLDHPSKPKFSLSLVNLLTQFETTLSGLNSHGVVVFGQSILDPLKIFHWIWMIFVSSCGYLDEDLAIYIFK